MYRIIGYEHIKSREGNEFTKVYITQKSQLGHKPFPVPYVQSGKHDFPVDVACNISIDIKQDGKFCITSLEVLDDIT